MRHARIGRAVVLCLALGATATVGITWLGLARTFGWGWEPMPGSGPMSGRVDTGVKFPWPHTPPPNWPAAATARWDVSSPWSDHATYLSDTGWMYDHRAGLPMRCLGCWEVEIYQSDVFTRIGTYGSMPIRLEIPLRQFLPCTPLWPGFAINTLFYAAVALSL